MDKLSELVLRRRACIVHRFLAAFQFSGGFLLVFFAAYIAAVTHGAATGAPYYAGAFISGFSVLILSVFGGTVYHRGKTTRLEVLIPTRVKPWVAVHLIISPCATVLCVVGVVITSIYGLCRSDKCSYSTNTDFNFGMAVFILVLELLCLISTLISIFISVYFASGFGLHLVFHAKPVPGAVQVRPVDDDAQIAQIQVAQDMYVQQLWRQKMEKDIDFRKVADYLEMSRNKKTEENMYD